MSTWTAGRARVTQSGPRQRPQVRRGASRSDGRGARGRRHECRRCSRSLRRRQRQSRRGGSGPRCLYQLASTA
eukprot:2578592-Pyramimonas_sp.AAC.1